MSQDPTVTPISKMFHHTLTDQEAKRRAEQAFAMYASQYKDANPSLTWKSLYIADVAFTAGNRRYTGTFRIYRGAVEFTVMVPTAMKYLAMPFVNIAAKEVEKWLKM